MCLPLVCESGKKARVVYKIEAMLYENIHPYGCNVCVCVSERARHAREDVVQYCYDVMQ